MAFLPPNNFENFGSASNLAAALNSAVTFDNVGGYSSIGFELTIPTGATVVFEATFDGTNWEQIAMRSQDLDLVQSSSTVTGTFIGSIACARQFRVRVSVAGSAAGTVQGRAQRDVSTLEGIEFGPPPHKIGFTAVHKDAAFTTAQAGTSIWTPAAGNKFVVTDIIITGFGATDAYLTLFDETDVAGQRLYRGQFDVSVNGAQYLVISLRVPYVSIAADNDLKVTTSADLDFDIIINGYEI